MGFIIYDLALLLVFILAMSWFLLRHKKNIKTEGMMLLYPTQWGVKAISRIGKKHPKIMNFLSYISITVGYLLMAGVIYLFTKILWVYFFRADIVRAVKIPPIMPLIPYLPQMFKIDWLPDFYFTYWIAILAVIAITHEFAHGIFAVYHKVRVKTTGFGFFPKFLPVFLAAFVELDEKKMVKQSKFKQLSVLSAGVFANVLTAGVFLLIMAGVFTMAFSPAGVKFDNYAYDFINISDVDLPKDMMNDSWINLNTTEGTYLTSSFLINESKRMNTGGIIVAYYNSPAIKANLTGAIASINGVEIDSLDALSQELSRYSPGEEIAIITNIGGYKQNYNIKLESNPENESKAWLGIVFMNQEPEGFVAKIITKLTSYKKKGIRYSPNWGDFSLFIYNLLWWTVLISISVAFVNMLPVGIFDGGRFFYLTVEGLTKSSKFAKKVFGFMTYLFLFLIVALMVFWMKSFL